MGTSWNQYSYIVLLLVICGLFYALPSPSSISSTPATTTTSFRSNERNNDKSHPNLPIPMDPFPEAPWRTPNTLAATVVASTPFARFELHKVRTESGVIVDDWMWTDERSHPALATLGGLFNVGETALQCAARELEEETGLVAGELVPLGKYRVQVNRGGGFLHAYLARDSAPLKHSEATNSDYEKQERRLLTREQLLGSLLGGEVGEAQWVATAALGLLREDQDRREE